MATGYLIDPETQTIARFDYDHRKGFGDIFKVGLCVGMTYPNGDVLYVDDEMLLRRAPEWGGFVARSRQDGQPMFDKAVLVGQESEGPRGWTVAPPSMTLEQARQEIRFVTRDAALSWFIDRANGTAGAVNGAMMTQWGDFVAILRGAPDTEVRGKMARGMGFDL